MFVRVYGLKAAALKREVTAERSDGKPEVILLLQMFPMALVTGNTMVVKPSERDPGACMILMELVNEAGFPPGVVNVIHGAHECT